MNKNYKLRDIKAPWPISQSKINLFETCKMNFYLRYLTDIGDLSTVWPGNLFGKTEHAILEEILKIISEGRRDEADILRSIKGMFPDKFNELRKASGKRFKLSREFNEETFFSDGEKYARILASFINKFLPQQFYKLCSELNVEVPYDEYINLMGIIDVTLFHDENKYEIYDLKITTESNKFYFVDWEYEIQSIMYDYLTQKKFNTKMDAFTFIVLNRHERALFLKQQYKVLDLERPDDDKFKDLRTTVDELKNFVFDIPTTAKDLKKLKCNKYDVCRWCAYKKEYCDKI